MKTFVDNDASYLSWVESHPAGYVVNSYRDPSRSYLVLHRASCPTIQGRPTHGTSWTSQYAKNCSTNLAELDSWANSEFGLARIVGCRACKPRSSASAQWPLSIGDQLDRKDLHQLVATIYGGGGGQRQGGISTPRGAPEILFFTDPDTGIQHGYIDAWNDDGCFHYTGEGQRGDQRMVGGNKAIFLHRDNEKHLRKFDGSSGSVTYAGEFAVADDSPYYETDAPETGGGSIRKVIVFRLRPLSGDPDRPTYSPDSTDVGRPRVRAVPVEQQHTERYTQVTQETSREIDRAEQALVRTYMAKLIADGHRVTRHEYNPGSYGKSLYSDLFDETTNTLIEAKGSVSRESIRMAIGQLADYARFESVDVSKAILLPERPRNDLEELLTSLSISILIPRGQTLHKIRDS